MTDDDEQGTDVTRKALYRSYLLRLWCDESGRNWRASLHGTAGEGIEHFASLEALFAHLLRQIEFGEGHAEV